MDDLTVGSNRYWGLLGRAALMGGVVGGFGLLFFGIVNLGTSTIWPDMGWEPFSGDWTWVVILGGMGLIVGVLRRALRIPDHVVGGVAEVVKAEGDYRLAPRTLLVTAVTLISGASLGPSYAMLTAGGGLGDWMSSRWGSADTRSAEILNGQAGGVGAVLTSPIAGGFLVLELGPIPRSRYYLMFTTTFVAALAGFAVFLPVAGRTFLDLYALPDYEFAASDLAVGAGLGLAASAVAIGLGLARAVTNRLVEPLKAKPILTTTVGGIVLGLVGWALPLTMFSGSSQLTTVLDNADEIGVAILATVLVAKMFTVMLSMSSGFIGGNVFPAIFLGGTAGALIHALFPEVPYALAVAAMMAAVPGAFLQAPLTLIIIAVITVGVSPANLPAIAIAVVVSFIATSTIHSRLQMRDVR